MIYKQNIGRPIYNPNILKLIGISLLMLCLYKTGRSQNDFPKDDNTPLPELHLLENDKLLKMAESMIQHAYYSYLAELRGYSKSEIHIKQTNQQANSLKLPTALSIPDEALPLEIKRNQLNQSKIWLETNQQQLKLLEAQKVYLEKHIAQITTTQLSANLLLKAFDDIKVFLLEINLRLSDRTLMANEVPTALYEDKLASMKLNVWDQPARLTRDLEKYENIIKTTVERISKVHKNILEATTSLTDAEEIYSEELKRQNLKQDYIIKPPQQLLRELVKSQEELIWLNGTFNLSYRRFHRLQKQSNDIRVQLESLSPPKFQDSQLDSTKIEESIKATITHEKKRIKKLGGLKEVLVKMIDQVKNYQADDIVLNEHLFRMQVLTGVVEELTKEGTLPKKDLPKLTSSKTLTDRINTNDKIREDVLLIMSKTGEQLLDLDQQIDNTLTAHKDAEDRLSKFLMEQILAKQARQWDSELKQLEPSNLIKRFKDNADAIKQNSAKLEKSEKSYQQLQSDTQKAGKQLQTVKDPLLRSIQQESSVEYKAILEKLFEGTDLKQPENLQPATAHRTDEKSLSIEEITIDNRQYQKIISTQIRNIEELQKYRLELLETMKELEKKTSHLAKGSQQAGKLSLQHYAIAIELKKRLGQQQLQSDEIPDGITDALQKERISKFENKSIKLSNEQNSLGQQIIILSQPVKTLPEQKQILGNILEAIGKRLDIQQDWRKLVMHLEAGRQALSEIEKKTLEQDALRLMESETTWQESMLGFVPSDRAENLTQLMQSLYQEWIELEGNQKNLQTQKDKLEQLIQSVGEEETIISQLMPLLQQQVTQLTETYNKEYTEIKTRILHLKASEQHKNKSEAIAQQLNRLFTQYLQIAATHQWIQLFELRLSAESLGAVLDDYQQQLGDFNIKTATIERRFDFLKGHTNNNSAKLPSEETPKSDMHKIRFSQGEIGVLRAERKKILSQEVIWVLGKIGIIIVSALLLVTLLNWIISRMLKRAHERNATAHNIFALSFMNAFLKFTIWVIAIIILFSVLGFHVGTIMAGLGIGGLAVAMAARETLANILGGFLLFFESPFSIGDVIKIGSNTAKVTGLTWRTTRLITGFGYSYSIPNCQVTEATIKNYTHTTPPGDFFLVYVSAKYDPQIVIPVINQALAECSTVLQDEPKGTWVAEESMLGNMTVMAYWPWWSLQDYHKRNGVRNEVWQMIWKHLNKAGIGMEIKPFNQDAPLTMEMKTLPVEIEKRISS